MNSVQCAVLELSTLYSTETLCPSKIKLNTEIVPPLFLKMSSVIKQYKMFKLYHWSSKEQCTTVVQMYP